MAYLSGSAVYVRMTRDSTRKDEWCGGISMLSDTFTYNFGTKVSSGTVTIVCELIPEESSLADEVASSSWDGVNQISGNIVPSTLDSLSFTENYVGHRGSALYLKGMSMTITDCTFTSNGAVDSYRESKLIPVYTEYIIGLDINTDPISHFTYDQSCGDFEYEDVDDCLGDTDAATSGKKVFES
jgi:hypothetical protein